jgi:hypothetical protein
VKYWEIIADNLKKAGWSWGCVLAIDTHARTIWIVDALHRKRESQHRVSGCRTWRISIGFRGNAAISRLALRRGTLADKPPDEHAQQRTGEC